MTINADTTSDVTKTVDELDLESWTVGFSDWILGVDSCCGFSVWILGVDSRIPVAILVEDAATRSGDTESQDCPIDDPPPPRWSTSGPSADSVMVED